MALASVAVTTPSDRMDDTCVPESSDFEIEAAENEVSKVVKSMRELEQAISQRGIAIQLQDPDKSVFHSDSDLDTVTRNGRYPDAKEGLTQSVDEALGQQWQFIRETLTAVWERVDSNTFDLRTLEGKVCANEYSTVKESKTDGPEHLAVTICEALVPLTERLTAVAGVIASEREARELLEVDIKQRLDTNCKDFDSEVAERQIMADKLWNEISSLRREALGKAPSEAFRPTAEEARVEAMMTAHADEARDHSEALRKLSESVTIAIEAHSCQILRATSDFNRLGKELTARLEDLEAQTQDLQNQLTKGLGVLGEHKSELALSLHSMRRENVLNDAAMKSVKEQLNSLDELLSPTSRSGMSSRGKGGTGDRDADKDRKETSATVGDGKVIHERRERRELSPGQRVISTPCMTTPVVPFVFVPQVRPPSPIVVVQPNPSSPVISQRSRSPSPSPLGAGSPAGPIASPLPSPGRSGPSSPYRINPIEGYCRSPLQIPRQAPLMSPASCSQLVVGGSQPYSPAVQPVQIVPGHSVTPVRMRPAVTKSGDPGKDSKGSCPSEEQSEQHRGKSRPRLAASPPSRSNANPRTQGMLHERTPAGKPSTGSRQRQISRSTNKAG